MDGTGVEISNSLKKGDWDGAGPLQDLPGHRTPALTLRQGALMHHQVVAVERQLISIEQTTAAQQQADIACD